MQDETFMKSATIVFPHQLFEVHPACAQGRDVFLVEEYLYFSQYRFHKQKIAFHRASMKFYEHYLSEQLYPVHYIEADDERADCRNLMEYLKDNNFTDIHYAATTDDWLERRIRKFASQYSLTLHQYSSPLFLNTETENSLYFSKKKKYFQTDFYIQQRKRLNILIDDDGTPAGGKWSFDADNREKYPKKKTPPIIEFPSRNTYYKEAQQYVNEKFQHHYGYCRGEIQYPCTFEDAKQWFEIFLSERFHDFGVYEDAIVDKKHFLHHSVLTPMLNVGLLTPHYIVERTLSYCERNTVPLNSVEGFIRQIIGWREFIRGVYEWRGREERTKNFWKFSRKIPASFWDGTTGIYPIDSTIQQILETGYCHHIERLMVIGNFMVLCEFDPDEVYQWFMEMFIDAYDWVMVPNVYGMSQFADGGIMSTKPYISGSNYLMKMSNYPKGDWQKTWDGLFWRFLHTHRDFFLKNPRLSMLVRSFDSMDTEKQKSHLAYADQYLSSLDAMHSCKAQ